MSKSLVVFLDSGIGGLPYLAWVKKHFPQLSVAYMADTRNFPYGELKEEQLKKAVLQSAQAALTKLNPDILAIVCNTASVSVLDDVRKIATCPVVGTVPALKTAAAKGGGPIGLLATYNTIHSPYVDGLISDFAQNHNVIRVAAGDIVRYVEEHWLSQSQEGARNVMEEGLSKLKQARVESLVIGCTHFLHVLDTIKTIMGSVKIIDSREGVGQRILSLIGDVQPQHEFDRFYVTQGGLREQRYRLFARHFDLEWAGQI